MLDKLAQIETRYEELTNELSSPELLSNPSAYGKAAKQHRSVGEVVAKYRSWKTLNEELTGARELMEQTEDEEMRELARVEIEALQAQLEQADNDLKLLLIPRDPNDEKNVILEIRAGIGGLKEAVALIEGDKVYSRLKHESGVHRVQRVPQTEASGRIHTSAITVAVLPEAEEVDVKIDPKDLRIDTFCSSGPGGQSVNTTYSAVRITHLPTGVVVSMQDEKSQIKNREKAMRVLRSRLQEIEEQKQHEAISSERRSMVGSGDRSEKIRTYNFKENRVTDHRIGLTIHQLNLVMDGALDAIIEGLTTHYQAEKLREEFVTV